jgi:hypothetical protein
MTPQRRAKIEALANDLRGDSATRALAQAMLARHPIERRNQQDPGIRTSAEYDRWRFMDLGAWRKPKRGVFSLIFARRNVPYHVILFSDVENKYYGSVTDLHTQKADEFGPFATIKEAHEESWRKLMEL